MSRKTQKIGSTTGQTSSSQKPSYPRPPFVAGPTLPSTGQQLPLLPGIAPAFTATCELLGTSLIAHQEFHFMSRYLSRSVEDNDVVYARGLNDDDALRLILAYQDWVRTFHSDTSTMSIFMMHDFWKDLQENAPEDFRVLSSYYGPLDHNQMKKQQSAVYKIWDKYRVFNYFYKYSQAFRATADAFGNLVDEGETALERTKLFYLWIVFFHGKENLFIDMGDRRLAAKHDTMSLSLESLIGLMLMKQSKSIVPGFEHLLALQNGDIIVTQMRALLNYASLEVRENILGIIDITSDSLSSAQVHEIREYKRRLFISAPKTAVSPYAFCTRPGIANLDATAFITNANKIMRKSVPGNWVEHMVLHTYKYLEAHPDFRFGKGTDKKTLEEWCIYLGYSKPVENAPDADNPVESKTLEPCAISLVTTDITASCCPSDLSSEETWAWEIVHNSQPLTFPMPNGVFGAMKAALKKALQYAYDENALKAFLRNEYIWVELFRYVHQHSKVLKKSWGSNAEFKKLNNLEGTLFALL